MTYPPGLLMRTVQYGPVLNSAGKPAKMIGQVSADTSVHYDPSDVDIMNDPLPVVSDAAGVITFLWPRSDQPFMSDGMGNLITDFTSTFSFEFVDSSMPSLPDITFLTPGGSGPLVLQSDLSATRTAGIVSTVDTTTAGQVQSDRIAAEAAAAAAQQSAVDAGAAAADKIPLVQKGAANGVPNLDVRKKVPLAQLPDIAQLDTLATVAADFVNNRFRMQGTGARVGTMFADTLRSDVAAGGAAFGSHKAFTNLVPFPLVGGALGVDQYSPGGGPGQAPTSWETHLTNTKKTWIEISPTKMVIDLEWNAANFVFGGVRTAVTISTDGLFTADVTVTSFTYSQAVDVVVGYRIDGAVSEDASPVASSLEGRTKASLRLHAPSGTVKQLLITAYPNVTKSAWPADGEKVRLTLENMRFIEAPSAATKDDLYQNAQYLTGAQAAVDQTLIIPDGDYVMIADTTDWGVVAVNATATGGAGLVISDALGGNFTVRRLWAIPRASYYPELLDLIDPIRVVSAPYKKSSSLIARALGRNPYRKLGAINSLASPIPYVRVKKEYAPAAQVATNRGGYALFDVRPGDVSTDDAPSGTSNERAEILLVEPVAAGTEFWIAGTWVLHDVYPPGSGGVIMVQERYTNPPSGPEAGITLQPEFSLAFVRPNVNESNIRVQTTHDKTTSGGANSLYFPIPWNFDTPNVPMSWVVRLKFGQETSGELQVWLNGVQKYSGTPIFGYDLPEGPQNHFGIYRASSASNVRLRMSVHNFERVVGVNALLDRVTRPRPLQRSLVID